MIRPHAVACLFATFLFACGGATTSGNSGSEADHSRDKASSSSNPAEEPSPPPEKTLAPPFTEGPSTTIDFQPTTIIARRDPSVSAECGKNDAPFSDDDRFVLQVIGTSSSVDAQFDSVLVAFNRTVEREVPHSLVVGPAKPYGRQQAESDGMMLVLVGAEPDSEGPISTPIRGATVTVLEVAQAEGAPLTARIQMQFESGATFDATISGPLVSGEGPCAD